MDSGHVHLVLSHAPLFAVAFGALALAVALVWQTSVMTRVGLALLVIAAVAAWPVFLTGEGAEDLAEGLLGVSETTIERHESVAGFAIAVVSGLGLLALIVLVGMWRRPIPRWVTAVALLGALGGSAVVGYTASLGGAIRHTEVASGAIASPDRGDDSSRADRRSARQDDDDD